MMPTIFDRRCCNRGPFGGFFKTLLLLITSFVIAIISSSSAGFANAALTPSEVNGNPVLLLVSCDQLTEPRTSVKGIVILMADITCDEPRVIEADDETAIYTSQGILHTKGVEFRVAEETVLRIIGDALVFENIEGNAEQIFVVEPGGFLIWQANKLYPTPEDGQEEDVHSLVKVENGGTLYTEGTLARYTESSITVGMKPIPKESSWITPHRNMNRRRQNVHSGHAGSATFEQIASLFSPEASAEYSFSDRLALSPSYLKVGEELRFPSSMSSAIDGSIMTLGPDGTLLLASHKRQERFLKEMQEAAKSTTATTMPVDNDGDDEELKLFTLLQADLAKAKPALAGRHEVGEDGIVLSIMDGSHSGGGSANGDTGAAEALGNKALEENLRGNLAQMHRKLDAQGQGEETSAETGSTTTNESGGDARGGHGNGERGVEERVTKCGNHWTTAAKDGSCTPREKKQGETMHTAGGGG
ncbi:unnamed protein product, partial [Pylaiella littoralis]